MVTEARGESVIKWELLLGAIAMVFAAPFIASASHYDVSYDAGSGPTAPSPFTGSIDGWYPSWHEQPVGDPFARSVTGAAGGGVTAWQISLNGPTPVAPNYLASFFGGHDYDAAKANGWSLRTEAQFVSGSAIAPAHGLFAYFDDTIFQFFINKSAAGVLQAIVHTENGAFVPIPLATGSQASQYHDYELRYDPTTAEVDFSFDGNPIHQWSGLSVPNADPNHGNVFRFGAINAAGTGVMNYRTADFETLDPEPTATEQGDYNGDGVVSLSDFTQWRDHLGSTTQLAADGNGNRQVDAGDYMIWKRNFGASVGAGRITANAQVVPEPASMLLLSFALVVIRRAGRRQRRAGRF